MSLTDYSAYSDYHNSTFHGGALEIDGGYGGHRALNNLFDQTTITANFVTNNYNGYGTNQNRIWSGGANDVVLITTNVSFEAGPLGRFYVPTNGPLVNVGSMTADSAGLYHFTSATNQTKEGTTTLDLGFHYAALTNGVLPDYDYDGLADYFEDANGNGLGDIGETLWLHSDTDYDGRSDGDEITDGTDSLNSSSVKLVRLGHWRFNDSNLVGDEGQMPDIKVNTTVLDSWSGKAVWSPSNSFLRYREIETNGRPNINCRNGTVRFWFKPDWSSTNVGGIGPSPHNSRLIELGGYSANYLLGHWELGLEPSGTRIHFSSASNGITVGYLTAPCSFVAGRWTQIALSYCSSNVALYLDGQPVTNLNLSGGDDNTRPHGTNLNPDGFFLNSAGAGIFNYPDAAMRSEGFRIGYDRSGGNWAKGQFEELETFNYPLTPQQIAHDFPNFNGSSAVTNDMDYDGRSDILEYQADGTTTNNASSVVGGRLGYWRFNGSTNNLLGEAMQVPLLVSGVSVTPGWSSNALVVSSTSTSALIYRDVETNGWANFNCRSGAARFWFKPAYGSGGPGHDAPFLYMGSAASANNGQWELGVGSNGKTVRFVTSSNSTPSTLLTANVDLTSNRWHHVAFNYSPTNLTLYINGALVTNLTTGLSKYPALVYRTEGLAIGNNTARARSVNGQFDELETFNRQLTASEMWRSFESFRAMDNDLNGTPDVLEDVSLAASTPFVGFPFVVTGTIEAEQFDKGGKGIAYTNVMNNFWTNDYRASQIEITNCTDKGLGYCVNNLRAGDWLNYTLDVRVGQTYAIEPRVAAVGTNVGGVFRFDFYTNGVKYTNTGPLTIASTNWSDLTYRMVRLAPGTNVMRLVALTNAPGASGLVGRFNYISVYPAWNEWWPTNGMDTNDLTLALSTNDTWSAANANAYTIQAAIEWLPNGGVVKIPAGTYYVAQHVTDESKGAEVNAAFYVALDNIAIQGAGKTNTTLVAYNRATTIAFVGFDREAETPAFAQQTNLLFKDLTLAGRPHLVSVTNSAAGGFTNVWEEGALNPVQNGLSSEIGCLVVCAGLSTTAYSHTMLFTNCIFRDPATSCVILPVWVSNVVVRGCDFIFRDGTNGSFPRPITINNTNWPTTTNYTSGGIGVKARAGDMYNLVVIHSTFNGNPAMSIVTNNLVDAGDGIVWFQGGGNWFVAHNAVTNYGLEGIQFNVGPAAATMNDFDTLVSSGSTCAFHALYESWTGPTGSTVDHSFSMVGNTIYGGRYAQLGADNFNVSTTTYRAHFTGNKIELYPPFDIRGDYSGAAFAGEWIDSANISGNTLLAGGHGVTWQDNSTNSLVLKNDFAAAAYHALSFRGTNGSLLNITAAKNILNQGVGSHLRLRPQEASSFFLFRNSYQNGSTNVNSFIEPAGTPIHFIH